MSSLSRANKGQKEKMEQFSNITGASGKIAWDALKQVGWAVEPAIDYYFSSGLSSATPSVDAKGMDAMYAAYKDSDDDVISAEGVMKLCADLEVDPADPAVLVMAFHMGAEAMGEFKKSEFQTGLLKMGVDSLAKLKKKIPALRAEMQTPDRFKDIYNFAYMFSREKGQKCVHLDVAVGMWQLLFSEGRWGHVDQWCEFLQKHHNRAISKDTWQQLYDFIKTVNQQDFSNYEESSSAWPYLLDEFVEHIREAKAA